MAIAVSAAGHGLGCAVERRPDAVPAARLADLPAMADRHDDPGDSQPALLDLDGRHRDHRAGRRGHPGPSRYDPGPQRDRRLCQRSLLRFLVLRYLVDPAADLAWLLAARPAQVAAEIRAGAVGSGLPSRYVQRGYADVRQGRRARLHGAPQPGSALGGRRRMAARGSRIPRMALQPAGPAPSQLAGAEG